MTLKQMVQVLIDKGHRRDWAEAQAKADIFRLGRDLADKSLPRTHHCSICRGHFTDLEDRYHYHPCE